MAYLDDNPPARSQFLDPRREDPSGVVVVHSAENTPDFVAFDGGAEAVANFIRNRTDAGSYHDLVDSDSCINLVRYSCEAYHDATGSNRHSYGVSVATRADVWPLAPPEWREGAVLQAAQAVARYAKWLQAVRGISIPARRITREQSEARVPGFISHAERDPARRHDPGAGFPWDAFLNAYRDAMSPPTTDIPEVFRMFPVIRCDPNDDRFAGRGAWYALTPHGPVHVPDRDRYNAGVKAGLLEPAVVLSAPDYDLSKDMCRLIGDAAASE